MATQEAHSTSLQALNTEILIGGVFVAGILGSVMQRRPSVARIKNIAHGGLSGFRIVGFYPLPNSIFLPDVVGVIRHVGRTIERAYDLDLIGRDAASELQAREGILGVLQKPSVIDSESVHH